MSSEAPVAPAGAAPKEEVSKNGGEGATSQEKGQTRCEAGAPAPFRRTR